MFRFLQINLRKSRSARRLIEQTARELGTNLLILSKIPKCSPDSRRWTSTSDGKAAVALSTTAAFAATGSGRGPGFVWMSFPGLLVYSYYWRPAGPVSDFKAFLSGLEVDVRGRCHLTSIIIVARDFSVKSPAWGSAIGDRRGEVLERFVAALELLPENIGSVPTFAVGDR